MDMVFEKGKVYGYDEIYKSLEGGSHGHYLLFKGDTVYAAFLSLELNPEAPHVVLVGMGPVIQKAGEALAVQNTPLPVFIKQSTDHWRYEGRFQSLGKLKPSTTEEMARAADRSDVAFAVALAKDGEAAKHLPVYLEGSCSQVTRNAYERSIEAREICLNHFGRSCCVCSMNFGQDYGQRGSRFIHVHHLYPLSLREGPSPTDPIKDLRPVCPNCHAMLHAGGTLTTPEALRELYWSEERKLLRQKRTPPSR